MKLFAQSVQKTLDRGHLVVPVKQLDVLWTPSVVSKLKAASAKHGALVELTYPDMIVGTYHSLGWLRNKLREEFPRLWLGTDIHHIVENQHLQFIGRSGVIGEHSYRNDEPCVLLPQDHHRLLMESLIGSSVTMHRERQNETDDHGIDYLGKYKEYKAKNPVELDGTLPVRTAKALHRAKWVSDEGPGARRHISEMMQEIYEQAYSLSTEKPLDQIAADTISVLSK